MCVKLLERLSLFNNDSMMSVLKSFCLKVIVIKARWVDELTKVVWSMKEQPDIPVLQTRDGRLVRDINKKLRLIVLNDLRFSLVICWVVLTSRGHQSFLCSDAVFVLLHNRQSSLELLPLIFFGWYFSSIQTNFPFDQYFWSSQQLIQCVAVINV